MSSDVKLRTVSIDFPSTFLLAVDLMLMLFEHVPPAGKIVKLNIWDTAGEEKYHAVTDVYYRNAAGVILVFDQTNPESFDNVSRVWIQQVSIDVLAQFLNYFNTSFFAIQ